MSEVAIVSTCDLCGTALTFQTEDKLVSFTAHDHAFCRASIAEKIDSLRAALLRSEEEIRKVVADWRRQAPLTRAIEELARAAAEWLRRGNKDPQMEAAMARLEALRTSGEPTPPEAGRMGDLIPEFNDTIP